MLNSNDLNNNELKIKNNKTKEEEIISLDALIYYLDEKLNTEFADEYHNCDCCCEDGCDCGCECNCNEDCDCGCQEGLECTCGGKCKCHNHEEDE